MKKIFIFMMLFSSFFLFNQVNANTPFDPNLKSNTTDTNSSKYYNNSIVDNNLFKPEDISSLKAAWLVNNNWTLTDKWAQISKQTDWKCWNDCYNNLMNSAKETNSSAAWDQKCADWNCLDKPNFMVDTSAFSIWKNGLKNNDWVGSWKKTINAVLWTIIQKLMIVLWTLSFAIITIWGYFMITSHWNDSLLTKWKNVVKWWILSLVIALSSYYIVNMVSYILYK